MNRIKHISLLLVLAAIVGVAALCYFNVILFSQTGQEQVIQSGDAGIDAFMHPSGAKPTSAPPMHAGCPVCPKRDPESIVNNKERPLEKPHDDAFSQVTGAIGWTEQEILLMGSSSVQWGSTGRFITLRMVGDQGVRREEGGWSAENETWTITVERKSPFDDGNKGTPQWVQEITWLRNALPLEIIGGTRIEDYTVGILQPNHFVVLKDGCGDPANCLDYYDIRLGSNGRIMSVQRVVSAKSPAKTEAHRTIIWFNSEPP